jgi:phospholipid/cholesterol/gamma-HCH transport system substrate-binding protein
MAKLPKNLTNIVVLAVVAAIVAGGVYYVFFRDSGQKTVTARFTSAVGVYPGTPVRILGVNVGDVTSVRPNGDYVAVAMEYDSKYKLPSNAGAVEVANSLVSDRYIQLTPVFRGGKAMATGAVIPTKRTGAPAELDDIYAALNKLSVALGPAGANKGGKKGALSALVDVGAANLKGNGAALGNSITKLSQAAQTLANSRGDLFGTVRNLQKFTTTLKNSDTQVRNFNNLLASVAGDLANERSDLGSALQQLGLALDSINGFVKKNAGKFHTDIKGLRSILGTLVKQKASLNETLAVAPIALANIVHAYDPNPGVLATRSNLASLTDVNSTVVLQKVCSTLNNLTGNLLGGLGGNIEKACTDVAGASGSTGGGGILGGTPPLPGSGTGLTGSLPGSLPDTGSLVGGQ